LSPQTSKSNNTYYKSKIEVIPTVNPAAALIAKMYEETPDANIREAADYDVSGMITE
jgi:hypothetical protein